MFNPDEEKNAHLSPKCLTRKDYKAHLAKGCRPNLVPLQVCSGGACVKKYK